MLLLLLLLTVPATAQAPWPRPVGPDLQLTGAMRTFEPSLAVQPDGGLLLAWAELGESRAWVQRMRPDGTREEPILLGRGLSPQVAVDGEGRFVVVWTRLEDPATEPGSRTVVGQRFRADGVPLGPVFPVSDTVVAPFFEAPRLAMRESGFFAVAWNDLNEPPELEDVRVRRFHPDGAPRGASVRVNQDRWMEQYVSGLAWTPDQQLVVAWNGWEGEGFFGDVWVRRIAADGTPLGDEALVNPDDESRHTTQTDVDVAVLDDGRAVLVWMDRGADFTDGVYLGPGIRGRVMGTDGTLGEVFAVNQEAYGEQVLPRIVSFGGDRLLVAWEDSCTVEFCDPPGEGNDGSKAGVFGRFFQAVPNQGAGQEGPDFLALAPRSTDLQLSAIALGFQLEPALAANEDGGLAVAWGQAGFDTVAAERSLFVRRLLAPCTPAPDHLCLGAPVPQVEGGVEDGGRFRLRVAWRDHQGGHGVGTGQRRGEWGTFWFFRPANVELAVKVLDGSRVNGYHWVFFASLSNVAFDLEVLDTATGLARVYHNPAGTFASRGDTAALLAPPVEGAAGTAASFGLAAPTTAMPTTAFPTTAPPTVDPPPLSARPAAQWGAPGPCVPSPTRACLQGGRFAVEIPTWRDATRQAGPAGATNLTGDTAYLWFFRQENPEVVVKVLDGRPVNGHFWVFFGGLTNVGFDLVVRDMATGEVAEYHNPLGTMPSRGDTAALFHRADLGGLATEHLLFVGAHPDDETLAAGLLGELCHTGTRCTFLVATRGEGGTCYRVDGCEPDLGTVRTAEMESSAAYFDADLVQWELPDVLPVSPSAVVDAWSAAAGGEEPLLADLEGVLRSVAPTAVLTLDPGHGSTGHPAHRALGALVEEAVERWAAAEPDRAPALWTLQTRVERDATNEYRFFRSAGAPADVATLDLTQASGWTDGSLWRHLLRVAQLHRSQFPVGFLAGLETVPEEQRRLHVLQVRP